MRPNTEDFPVVPQICEVGDDIPFEWCSTLLDV